MPASYWSNYFSVITFNKHENNWKTKPNPGHFRLFIYLGTTSSYVKKSKYSCFNNYICFKPVNHKQVGGYKHTGSAVIGWGASELFLVLLLSVSDNVDQIVVVQVSCSIWRERAEHLLHLKQCSQWHCHCIHGNHQASQYMCLTSSAENRSACVVNISVILERCIKNIMHDA